jgi:Tfp pilus assembly protein PilO
MKAGVKELLFALIMIGLLAGAWYFVFRKANDRIARLREDTKDKQVQLDLVEQALRQIEDVEQEISSLRQKAEVFENRLPSAGDVQVILHQITGFGTKHRLSVSTVRMMGTEKSGLYMEDRMAMSVQGDFAKLYEFLLDIERMDRITRLSKVELRRLPEDGAVAADLGLSIFYVPDGGLTR